MKTRLSLFCIAITMLLSFSIANAQQFGQLGSGIGGQQQSAFRAVSGDLLQPGLPGRLWFETNFADQGLGFDGSYLTLGGKTRLFQDALDGRWLLEGQFNHSIEDDGGLFLNIGIERVFSVASANADISFGVFYDYDEDDQQGFSEGFHQIGVSGAIKTPRGDLIGNGYLPVGTEDFTVGDVLGTSPFVGNNIALQAGIESALQGFDLTLRTRPKQLAFTNGYVDFGVYHYDSDVVDPFAGGRLRAGFQLINGLQLAAEINHDERFDTTGALSLVFNFGASTNGRGSEYAGLARDLEQFARNDHIVRFSQDLIVAINPVTGQPFNVIHANNTQLGIGDGTIESPFATLAEAEAASSVDDIIFVDVGDGTDTGYQNGITLQDRQQLLSGGGTQFIQNVDGILFEVTTPGSAAATISNVGGNEVVLLADDNVIGGINIDATDANFGAFGSGVSAGAFNGASFSGADLDGVGLENVTGDLVFNNIQANNNGGNGVGISGGSGSVLVTAGTFSTNAAAGLEVMNFQTNQPGDAVSIVALPDGTQAMFINNTIGVNLALEGPGLSQTASITGATFNTNDRSIVASADGLDTELNLNVGGTTILTTSANQAIDHLAEGGATLNSVIAGFDAANPLVIAGNSTNGVTPTINYSLDGVDAANPSEINALISDVNIVTATGGAAIGVLGTGESVIELLVEDSLVQSNGNSVQIALDNNIDGDVNQFFFNNVDIRAGNNGILATTLPGTLLDISVVNSLLRSSGAISDTSPAFIPGNPNVFLPFTDALGNVGIQVNTTGGAAGGLVSDNLTRLNILGNTIEDFTFDGININTFGDAQLFANIQSNNFLRNGPAQNDDGASDDGVVDGPTMPIAPSEGFFDDAIDITANGISTVSLALLDNDFINNFERSVNLTTNGGTINGVFDTNRFASDIGVDTTAVPVGVMIGELGVQNNGGNICLALTTNTFQSMPLNIINAAAPANVQIGLDGLTNGFNAAAVGGVFTPTAFGLCEALVDAEETLFEGNGFTPLNP